MAIAHRLLVAALMMSPTAALPSSPAAAQANAAGYPALVELFREWRAFARPEWQDGVPDYTAAAMAKKAAALPAWQARLAAIDPGGWPVEQRTEYQLVKAEMNGMDFDQRVLRPWARDPGFYVTIWPSRTDVPAREAPVAEPETHLYAYAYPLSAAAQEKLTAEIGAIPGFLAQGKVNLKDANARDLWVYSVASLDGQLKALQQLQAGTLKVSTLEGSWNANLNGASPALRQAVAAAIAATQDFIGWLKAEAPSKTGSSGVGKENYSWYQKNVHMVPYDWDEEVALLRRELARAHAGLRLEEHNNRKLPQLQPVASPAAFDRLARERLDKFVDFLVKQEVIPDKPYLKAALVPQMGHFVPEERRSFFAHIIAREPMLLYSHDYHWIDLARMRDEPHASAIRREPSLSNIWDVRAEGFATAFEELVMHAGLYDDNPRARELVWIMLANRAARGLASLYVQSNEWSLKQAGHFHAEWTPRGWSNPDDELTAFEQLLYLRQPGYGTSYIVGKIELDQVLAEYSHALDRQGKPFKLSGFLDAWNKAGMIPPPLIADEIVPKP
ncbi:DUF885 family protein [Sphingomonas sp.]|uniref:DUF885 family protein n=1 Tax=Sphingomonas sp. TaxID=28214 RepID=UPI0031DC68B6